MFKGKVMIVTGGSNGMGKYMAKKFAQEGANVVITGRDQDRLNAVKEEIGENAHIFQMDVRNVDSVQAMVDFADEQFGRIDGLVNNAAGNFIVRAEDLSPNGWNSVIDIVLNGTFYCSSAVGKYWIEKKQQGSIINMLATYAWDAGAGVIHSAAAKAGVMSLTRTLAVEWGTQYGIRVNGVLRQVQSSVLEEQRGFGSPRKRRNKQLASIPLGRLGKPEEVAELAAFIMSEKAAYMNGEIITLDGGQWLNKSPF